MGEVDAELSAKLRSEVREIPHPPRNRSLLDGDAMSPRSPPSLDMALRTRRARRPLLGPSAPDDHKD